MTSFKNSQACSKSELDLFYTLPTNTSIIKSNIMVFPTINPLGGNEDTFTIEIPPTEEYTDLNDIFLELEINIKGISTTTKRDTGNTKDIPLSVAPINNFAHSIFRNIELSIGTGLKKTIIESGNYYPYKAYLLNLLNFSKEIKDTSMGLGLWITDESVKFDDSTNTGFINRRKALTEGKDFIKLIAPIHMDLLNSNRFLLSRHGLTFTFKRSDDKFSLMGDDFNKLSVNVMKANILARRCIINPSVVSAHQNASQLSTIKYPIKQSRINVAYINPGRTDFTPPSFLTTIPNKIVVGMVEDSAYNGNAKNPFNFQNFDVTKITLTIDSQDQCIRLDKSKNDCSEAYHAMFQSLNLYNQGSMGLTQQDFMGGNCLYCFNLNPDKGCEEQFNQLKSGSVVLKFEFSKLTDVAIKVIIFMEYDNQINIDNKGEVYFDHILN
jgi:hypothetical protein